MAPRAVDDGLSKKVVGLEAVVVLEDDLKLLHTFSYRARCLHLKEQLMHCFLNYRYTSLGLYRNTAVLLVILSNACIVFKYCCYCVFLLRLFLKF